MISRTLGAPLGGTTVGGHHGLESLAFSLITPPNFGSGAGTWFPLIVVVALGEPGVPVVCWPFAAMASAINAAARNSFDDFINAPLFLNTIREAYRTHL